MKATVCLKSLCLCAALALPTFAKAAFPSADDKQTSYVPTQENLQSREAFQNDKFGIFSVNSLKTFKLINLREFNVFLSAVLPAKNIRSVYLNCTSLNSADADSANIIVIFKR